MKNILLRIMSVASARQQTSDATVHWAKELRISTLRTVKNARGGNAANKAGRIVLRGEIGGRSVKVYEAFNEEHARFIEAVCTHDTLQNKFPNIYGVSGRFIAADWLEGQPLKQLRSSSATRAIMRELVGLQTALHSVSANALPACGFDYWRDLVRPRFVRAMELMNEAETAAHAAAIVDTAWSTQPRVVMHPDVTPVNVLRRPSGALSIIDNELMTSGGMPLMDLCNTLRAFGRGHASVYAETYLDHTAVKLTADTLAALEAMWFARCAGSDFVAGQVGTVRHRVEMFKERKSQLPFALSRS